MSSNSIYPPKKMNYWTEDEHNLLRIHWPNARYAKDITHLFVNRDSKSIDRAAYKLNLVRSDEITKQIMILMVRSYTPNLKDHIKTVEKLMKYMTLYYLKRNLLIENLHITIHTIILFGKDWRLIRTNQ